MSTEKFSDAMGEINDRYLDEAISYHRNRKKLRWVKWTSLAACFALAAVLGIGVWQGGWFGRGNDIVTLDHGDTINFVKSDAVGGSLSLAIDITSRELTAEEIQMLFADLPASAQAIFTVADHKLIGFDGKIGGVKMVVSTSDIQLLDTVIVGDEQSTEVNGVCVTAGYFITNPNSKNIKTAIYYATFELGDSTVYVENAGTQAEREATKNELVSVIQKLIENGEFDLLQFQE